MKADMNAEGVVAILPENSVEEFALRQWVERAAIRAGDSARGEDCVYRGSMLEIDFRRYTKGAV